MPVKGYSLMEVIVAVFVLAGIVLSSFSVIEMGSRQSLKIENQMTAARLAQQISEKLHSMYSSEMTSVSSASFPSPFERYQYLYTVAPSDYAGLPNLQRISVMVKGPLSASNDGSVQTATVSLSLLMARQAYSP